MKTNARPQLLKQSYKLGGGVDQAQSTWTPGVGWWQLIGMQGDDTDALTKWSGSALWTANALAGRVNGLFQVTLNNTISYVLMAGGKIYRSADGAALAELLTGQTPGMYDGRVLGSIFFMVSGVNPNKKLLDNLTIQGVGVAAPTVAPAASIGPSGALTGQYTWLYTYKNSLSGAESNQSPISNVLNPAAKAINLTFTAPTDSQVDKILIYRTQAGGSIYQLVATISSLVLTYQDNSTDGTLGIQVSIYRDVPPAAKFLEAYNGMLLYTGFARPLHNRVMPSSVLLPEAVSQFNVYELDPEDNDQITGIKKFGQAVAVYKANGLFLGSGTTPDSMTFVRTRVVEGSLGNHGIIPLKSSHCYLSQKGPHVFTGLQEEFFGRPVQPLYRTFDQTLLADASGVYYRPLNMLLWNVKTAGMSDYDSWLIYNVLTKEWTTRAYATSRLSTYLDTLNQVKLWLGKTNGQVLTGDIGNADNGVGITIDGITRGIALGDSDQLYCFRHITIWYDNDPTATAPISVSFVMDNPLTADRTSLATFTPAINSQTGTTSFLPSAGVRSRFNLPVTSAYGRLIFVRLQSVSTNPLKIRGIHIEGLPLGRF